ncbi:dTMP kinase [Brevundimonas sp.]|uniref:dTMP kinase n=1 Tax=Brevundimonas sp. TaxID=1871086 RepID=UPI003F70A410
MPFVSFEGIDGCGKSTQLARLADWLEGQGETVVRTREPGGGQLGGPVGDIFRRKNGPPMSALEQMLLINAARVDHVRSVIRPAVARGDWVLSDRFYDSTFALQVFESGLPLSLFDALRDAVTEGLKPDLTLILDLDPEIAAIRRGERIGDDPLERHRDFSRIRRGFQTIGILEPDRCRVIDARGAESDVASRIHGVVRAWREADGSATPPAPPSGAGGGSTPGN